MKEKVGDILEVLFGLIVLLFFGWYLFGPLFSNDNADAPLSSTGDEFYYTEDFYQENDYDNKYSFDGCDIKGNISYSTGEKIYHLPGDEYYDKTEIDEYSGEEWFCSEEEAENAGFRRAFR